MKMQTVAILGGAGYIGTHLIKLLLTHGAKVKVLDRLIFGSEPINEFKNENNFELIVGDIRNIRDVSRAIKGSDIVIHLAGLVGDPACQVDEEITWSHNTESSVVIADVCNYYNVKRLIFASSCSVYGSASSDITLNEGSYKNPVSLYAKTKIESEQIFTEKFKGIYSALRLATVFGHSNRMRFDLVPNLFTIKAVKEGKISVFGGTQYRPFIHCFDAARAFYYLTIANGELIDREVFNVSVENYTITGLGSLIKDITGCEIEFVTQKEDNRNYKVSSEKIEWILGYKPTINVEDGIIEMVEKINEIGYNNWKDDVYKNCSWEY
jgi:nucleoside-diphosphate-sugar epimerase